MSEFPRWACLVGYSGGVLWIAGHLLLIALGVTLCSAPRWLNDVIHRLSRGLLFLMGLTVLYTVTMDVTLILMLRSLARRIGDMPS